MNLAFLNDKTPLEAALYYATKLRWPVFPLYHPMESDEGARCSCGKISCENIGKHPRVANWTEEASTEPEVIQAWWKKWPRANIGVCTGNTFLVIDFDAPKGGLSSYAEVLHFEPRLKKALSVQTGGGGKHLFARIPLSAGAIRNRVNIWQGVDIRADRGYVVAAPSLHASMRRYQWTSEESELIELSEAFIEKIKLKDGDRVPKDALRNAVIPQGQRDDTLFRIAASRVSKGGESLEDTLSFLRRVNHERCDPPLDDTQVVKIVHSAYTYPPSFLQTDVGNAVALDYWFGKNLRWTAPLGWLEWEDSQWNEVTDVHIRTYVHTLSGMLLTIAKTQDNESLDKWAHLTQLTGHISAAIKEFQPRVEVKANRFEGSGFLLPCLNGTLDLSGSGHFRASEREDYMTRRIPVEFDAIAKCPRWEEALNIWFDGDQELISYIQRVVGYCLTGDRRHQCFFILYGSGANGKSTFIRTLQAMLGSFSVTMNGEALMRNAHVNRETEAARLFGTRLAVCSESSAGSKMDEEFVKKLTGGENITGRKLYRDAIEFKPTSKLMLHTNHKPKASTYDDAIWRRIVPIPFTVVIPKEQRNPYLPWQLQEELPGILAWAVRGTHEEREAGRDVLSLPMVVAEAKKKYYEENDVVKEFLEETLVRTENKMDRIPASALHLRYTEWCRRERRGASLLSRAFISECRDRQGLQPVEVHKVVFWAYVRFVGSMESPESVKSSISLER